MTGRDYTDPVDGSDPLVTIRLYAAGHSTVESGSVPVSGRWIAEFLAAISEQMCTPEGRARFMPLEVDDAELARLLEGTL